MRNNIQGLRARKIWRSRLRDSGRKRFLWLWVVFLYINVLVHLSRRAQFNLSRTLQQVLKRAFLTEMAIYCSFPPFFPSQSIFCVSLLAQGDRLLDLLPRDQQNHLWNSENLVTKALILPSILVVGQIPSVLFSPVWLHLLPKATNCTWTDVTAFCYGCVTSSHSRSKQRSISRGKQQRPIFSSLLTLTMDKTRAGKSQILLWVLCWQLIRQLFLRHTRTYLKTPRWGRFSCSSLKV